MTAIAVLIGLSYFVTLAMGGTRTPAPHLFYLPVVLAAGIFGVRAGLVAAVFAGVVCGPLMPLDASAGTPQSTSGWLVRLGFFLIIALVVGYGRNRLLALSRAQERFLSVVSHELRTPLASVVGFATILNDGTRTIADDERDEFVQLILKESVEMSNVVDHYVVESRLDGSGLFIDPKPTDLRRIVDIVLEGLPSHVRDDRIEVSGDDVVCIADPLRLRQILRSVFNNALAYASDKVSIVVAAERNKARVRVHEEAFDRQNPSLRRLGTWAADKGDAAGLPLFGIGLAVSRDLAKLMGGDLDYSVNGTTDFDLKLPLHRPHRVSTHIPTGR